MRARGAKTGPGVWFACGGWAAVVVLVAGVAGVAVAEVASGGPGAAGAAGAPGAAGKQHPFLAEAPENRDWLAPAGVGHAEFVGLVLGDAPRLRLRAEALAGKTVELTIATDATALEISRGAATAKVELAGDQAMPQVVKVDATAAPKLDLNGAQVIGAEKDWPGVVGQANQPWVLRFVGGKRVKLQYADAARAAPVDEKEAADFFGIPVDPNNPAYRRIARRPDAAPGPEAAARPVLPSNPQAPDPQYVQVVPPPVPTQPLARDFPPVDDAALTRRLTDATFVIEASTTATGVTRPAVACWVDASGLAVVNLSAVLHARKLEAVLPTPGAGAGAAKVDVEMVAVRPELDLALVKCGTTDAAGLQPAGVVALPELAPAGGVAVWQAGGDAAGKVAILKGAVVGDEGWRPIGRMAPLVFEPTVWLGVQTAGTLRDAGGPVLNPGGELVGWSTTLRGGPAIAAPELRKLLDAKGTASEQLAGQLRELRAHGRLGYLAWPRLRVGKPEPAATLQRETIKLDRGMDCPTCQGKGTVTRQRHIQLPSSGMGAGRDRVVNVEDRCPACEGGSFAPGETITRLLEGVAATLAITDTADAKWGTVSPFVTQTLREMLTRDPEALFRRLAAVKMPDPMTFKPGDAHVAVGRTDPRETSVPDALVIEERGHTFLLTDAKLNAVTRGGEVLFGGLVAGHVRLAEGRVVTVLTAGFAVEAR